MMSLGDHLEELRKRVIWALAGIIPLLVASFLAGPFLLGLLIAPAKEELLHGGQATSLLATAPFETFGSVLHLSMVVTLLLGSPWILLQLWLFVSPGLYAHERRFVRFLVPLSSVLAVGSVFFVYYAVLPVVLSFFVAFGSSVGTPKVPTAAVPDGIVLPEIPVLEADPPVPTPGQHWINAKLHQHRFCIGTESNGKPVVRGVELISPTGIVQQYRVSEYLKTILNLGLGFGAGFQLPVVVVMLGWVGIVERWMLTKYRKHAIAISCILSAVLTPADPISMLLLAIPLCLLYELGIFLLWVFPAERVARGVLTREPDGDADDETNEPTP